MAGLNHDFLVIKTGSYSIDNYEEYSNSDHIELHDNFIQYLNDYLSWVPSYNPCMEEDMVGLCFYASTLISYNNIDKFSSIISGLITIFSVAPQSLSLTGL